MPGNRTRWDFPNEILQQDDPSYVDHILANYIAAWMTGRDITFAISKMLGSSSLGVLPNPLSVAIHPREHPVPEPLLIVQLSFWCPPNRFHAIQHTKSYPSTATRTRRSNIHLFKPQPGVSKDSMLGTLHLPKGINSLMATLDKKHLARNIELIAKSEWGIWSWIWRKLR